MKVLLPFMLLLLVGAHGQNITRAEYFFDTDPGQGNGLAITIPVPGQTVQFTTSIPAGALPPGFHFLMIRVKEGAGPWGIPATRGFYISSGTVDVPNITAAEYFIDTDPGNGNGTPVAVTPGANVSLTFAVPTNTLPSGFHLLVIRTQGADGRWGLFESRGFYITAPNNNTADITEAEYFFDTDPGVGNGTTIPVTPGATTTFTVGLPSGGLAQGFHNVTIRTKGADGKWGLFENRSFYISGGSTDSPLIAAAEYFFDVDPGVGSGTDIPVTPGAAVNLTVDLPVSGLQPGFHLLVIRGQFADGRWGMFESRGFYLTHSIAGTSDIVAAEFFIDADPGEGNGDPLTVNTPGQTINELFTFPIQGVPSGMHTLGMRVRDAEGAWSQVQTAEFELLACIPPAAPTAASQSRCESGTLTLDASGAGSGQVYRWYEDETTTTVLFTGASFLTPTLSVTTEYFVAVYDPVTLCESSRISVTAGVVTTAPPILNITGNVTICQGNAITLTAPTGFSSYLWSSGEATRQITVSASGDYTVVVGAGSCVSPPSAPASIIVAPAPAKPAINVTGGPLCGGQSVSLDGPAGFMFYTWSNGGSSQQVNVALAGLYTLTVTDNNGCTSPPSDVVEIHAPPAKPTVFIVGNTTLCQGQSVTLVGPTGLSIYAWSGGETTPAITVGATGSYTLQVTDGNSCVSPLSDPVAVTVNPLPAKPVIAASGNTSFCVGQSITLSGPSGFSYIWSTGATTSSISVNQTDSYSLIVIDGQGCASAVADPTTVTVTPCNVTNARPPAIQGREITCTVEGQVSINLSNIFSDPDDDLDLSSLKIVTPPPSQAVVSVDANGILALDYRGILFAGTEMITIEVCDLANNCTRKELTIHVVGEIVVFNAVSPNGDDRNETLYLEYIDLLQETRGNRVRIFNRWGALVYEAKDYNNDTIGFKGIGTNGDELASGTYFYRIDFDSGIPFKTGFFALRR